MKINSCGKLRKGSNEGVDWVFPQFQEIKETSVDLSINEILQGCVGMVNVFKRIYAVGTSICCGYSDDMVINPNLNILSAITHGEWNFRGENRILLYLEFFNDFLYAVRALQGERDVTAMIYHTIIYTSVDDKNY